MNWIIFFFLLQVIVSKGQAKISSFFVKQTRQTHSVLSDRSNTNLSVEVQTSPYFMKNAVTLPAKQSSPEVILSDEEILASPKVEVKNFDENCDLTSTPPNQNLPVKRKLCSGEEIPDVIPGTPITKNRRIRLTYKHTKRSNQGIGKLENRFSPKGTKQDFSSTDSVDNVYNSDVIRDTVVSVNNPKLENEHPCSSRKVKLNGIESICTQEYKSSDDTIAKMVTQIFSEKSDKSTIKNYENGTQGSTKQYKLLERVRSHDNDNHDLKCSNLPSTEQCVNSSTSAGCNIEAGSIEQLLDTSDNISLLSKCDGVSKNIVSHVPEIESATVILSNDADIPAKSSENLENKVSCNVSKAVIKQHVDLNSDRVYTCNILDVNESKTKQNTYGTVSSKETVSSDILKLNCNCDSIGYSNESFGCDVACTKDKVEEGTVVSKCTLVSIETVLENSNYMSDSVNPEANGSDCRVQKNDQYVDVLCDKVQTGAVQQMNTESVVNSLSDISKEDAACLLLDGLDFSLMEDTETE